MKIPSGNIRLYGFALIFLGFLAMSVQILFIREVLALFQGNELVIGICLGFWMILTATGSYLCTLILPAKLWPAGGRRNYILAAFLFLTVYTGFISWILISLKSMLVPVGVSANLFQISFLILITIAPFSIVSGALFPVLASGLTNMKRNSLVPRAYALDSVGSILGGISFSVLLFISLQQIGFHSQSSFKSKLYPGQEVIEARETPFGRLTITKMEEQVTLYENSIPLPVEGDAAKREEAVHYGMLAHPRPERVLMISGGIGGTIEEVFKYPGVHLDYLEINPWLVPMVSRHIKFPVHRDLNIINKDPRIYLRQTSKKYDVILVNVPDPGSAELNRYYTREFFRLLNSRLNEEGIVSISIPAAGNYMNETSRILHSVTYNTLLSEFMFLRIIPGNRDFYLASDNPLVGSFREYYQNAGITNLYVNPGYIQDELIAGRSSQIISEISEKHGINSDLKPFIYLQVYRKWLEKSGIDYRIIPLALFLVIILAFLVLGPLNLGLFTGGFTSSSLEFILILWLQVIYGFIYQMTGLIFATFMAGIVAGTIYGRIIYRTVTIKAYYGIQASFAIFSLIISGLMAVFPFHSNISISIILIFSLILIAGMLMGVQFAMSVNLRTAGIIRSAGESFSADLLGSAVGIILVSVIIVPIMGLLLTGELLAGMNLVALLFIFLKIRRPVR